MNEETIFAAALELRVEPSAPTISPKPAAEMSTLRKRLEGLIAASERAGNFMARPAIASAEPANAATEIVDGASTPHDVTVTRNGSTPLSEEQSEAVSFLSPSTRPDSLGRIGHYEVLEVLGRGGFGIVFRAFDDVLQRVVAVKVLAPQTGRHVAGPQAVPARGPVGGRRSGTRTSCRSTRSRSSRCRTW